VPANRAFTSERATTPGLPVPGVVARTGLGLRSSPVSGADGRPTAGRRGRTHPDHRPNPKNAIDAVGVTCKQANTPGRRGPNGRGRSRRPWRVAPEEARTDRQPLRRGARVGRRSSASSSRCRAASWSSSTSGTKPSWPPPWPALLGAFAEYGLSTPAALALMRKVLPAGRRGPAAPSAREGKDLGRTPRWRQQRSRRYGRGRPGYMRCWPGMARRRDPLPSW
jgi:hypothetical protein